MRDAVLANDSRKKQIVVSFGLPITTNYIVYDQQDIDESICECSHITFLS